MGKRSSQTLARAQQVSSKRKVSKLMIPPAIGVWVLILTWSNPLCSPTYSSSGRARSKVLRGVDPATGTNQINWANWLLKVVSSKIRNLGSQSLISKEVKVSMCIRTRTVWAKSEAKTKSKRQTASILCRWRYTLNIVITLRRTSAWISKSAWQSRPSTFLISLSSRCRCQTKNPIRTSSSRLHPLSKWCPNTIE